MEIQQIKFKGPNSYSILIGNNIIGILPKKIKIIKHNVAAIKTKTVSLNKSFK